MSVRRRTAIAAGLAVLGGLVWSGCGGSSGGGGGGGGTISGANADWPGQVVGYQIEFTVQDPGTAGLQTGLVIVYDYGAGGQVQGTNPATGQVYTPQSYAYTDQGTTALVRLDYGAPTYEEYTLTPVGGNINSGTYEYRAETSTSVALGIPFYTASGTYRILSTGP